MIPAAARVILAKALPMAGYNKGFHSQVTGCGRKEELASMYDMSGFSYDIRDVVRILNLKIRHTHSNSYDVDCPFCGDSKGKMNVHIGRNVFRCNRCDTSGGMLDLYAKLYCISTSEANRQIREAMNLGMNRDDYEWTAKKVESSTVENSELASADEIHCTYS